MTMIGIVCRDVNGVVTRKRISAAIVGHLAIHLGDGVKTLDGKPSYSITHIPSGLRASPFYFESEQEALTAARVMGALPVDWSASSFGDRADHVRHAVYAISDLCGGYLIDSMIEQKPAGHA